MCGIFGIYAPERDVARLTHFGLLALQHRGQESAGIAVTDDGHLMALRDMGLVAQVFTEETLRGLQGQAAIGHTRYSTTGTSSSVLPPTVPISRNGTPVSSASACNALRLPEPAATTACPPPSP